MSPLLQCLLTATTMLTVSCGMAALFFRRFEIVTPRLRQWVLFSVMLQGLMLIRIPVELPWLESDPHEPARVMASEDSAAASSAMDMGTAKNSVAVSTSVADSGTSASSFAESRGDLAVPVSISRAETVGYAALGIWLAGFVFVVVRSSHRYRSLCRLINQLDHAPSNWCAEWERVCRDHGQAAPEMMVSQSAGPMLVRRPSGYALVVPACFWQSLSKTQRRGVLLHELAHLRRRDVWRQLIARFAAALHWWNPAAWWCVRRYEESAEWACDESLTRRDPDAAKGLASSLVQLVEYVENQSSFDQRFGVGLGVQAMAAPPLTERVTRLLKSSSHGDSVMKRLLLLLLAAGLLSLSTVQFRLVAADSGDDDTTEQADSGLRVLSPDSKDQLQTLRQRLNPNDKASSDLKRLLDTEAGQVAFAGVIDLLKSKYREKARGEAIPRFVEKHFETTSGDRLQLRDESRDTAASWVSRSKQLGQVLDSMRNEMKSIADRLDDSGEVNQMARRMLTDEHSGYAIMLDDFGGRSDPIELFLNKALEKTLVRRGEKLVVIPTLSADGRRQIERFELATKVAERLRVEMPEFGKEFATPDQQHKDFVAKMSDPAMAAVVALHVTKENAVSASAVVDQLFEQLETISRDTAKGLVIRDEEAWANIDELIDFAERAGKRVQTVRERMKRIATELDTSDPMTARFAAEMTHGVIAYQVAVDIPYAEFDLGKQVEAMVSQVMEPAGNDRLRIRDDAAAQVGERAEELLTACRTIRRYLRRVDAVCDRMEDEQLAESLQGPGRMLLLTEIRRLAEQGQIESMELLAKEFFLVDETTNQLTVRPERVDVVSQLILRAKELEQELSKDDF